MGFNGSGGAATNEDGNSESSSLLLTPKNTKNKIPKDSFHLAYAIYFTLGTGYLLPWNTFITAVDYFSNLYPEASVDRVFAIVYMLVGLVAYAHKSDSFIRIKSSLSSSSPVMDVAYIKGRTGIYDGFYMTVVAVAFSAVADALVQGGIIGAVGELPERYMQAVVAGTVASGTILSFFDF